MFRLINHQVTIPRKTLFSPSAILKKASQLRAVSVSVSITLENGPALCCYQKKTEN